MRSFAGPLHFSDCDSAWGGGKMWQISAKIDRFQRHPGKRGKICQKWQIFPDLWQKTDFFRISDQNLSFLTDFGSKICHFKICQIWQILNSESVKFDRLQIFSGFLAKICHFWQILTAKSVILKSVKFDRFWTQNLSNLTENRFFWDFGPKSVIFDRFWQLTGAMTIFEKICHISPPGLPHKMRPKLTQFWLI